MLWERSGIQYVFFPSHHLQCGGEGQDKDNWKLFLDGKWWLQCEYREKRKIPLIQVLFWVSDRKLGPSIHNYTIKDACTTNNSLFHTTPWKTISLLRRLKLWPWLVRKHLLKYQFMVLTLLYHLYLSFLSITGEYWAYNNPYSLREYYWGYQKIDAPPPKEIGSAQEERSPSRKVDTLRSGARESALFPQISPEQKSTMLLNNNQIPRRCTTHLLKINYSKGRIHPLQMAGVKKKEEYMPIFIISVKLCWEAELE